MKKALDVKLKAWAIRNKHGGWIRNLWLNHAQLGETDCKVALYRLRKKEPEMDYRMVLVRVTPERFVPFRSKEWEHLK